jgi:hypothetical protein
MLQARALAHNGVPGFFAGNCFRAQIFRVL